MDALQTEINSTQEWFESPRFKEITRLYSARQVVEQRGSIHNDYSIARKPLPPFLSCCESFTRSRNPSRPWAHTPPARS